MKNKFICTFQVKLVTFFLFDAINLHEIRIWFPEFFHIMGHGGDTDAVFDKI